MTIPPNDWIQVISYENLPGSRNPTVALKAWLRDRGIDCMPFASEDIRIDLACGPKSDDHWHGQYTISVRSDALRRLGLHPDQQG